MSVYEAVSMMPKLQHRAQEGRDAKSVEHLPKMFITIDELLRPKN